VLKTGCRWRDVPAEYGPATTVYNSYNRWSRRGLWQRLFEQVAPLQPRAAGAYDRQLAREGASLGVRRKRGEWEQAVGRSRGGRTSKIHCLADDRGRPIAFVLTPGNIADINMALPLLGAVTQPKRLIGDKAYAVDSLRRCLKERCIRSVIPSSANRTVPYPLDRPAYRRRNLIERLFCGILIIDLFDDGKLRRTQPAAALRSVKDVDLRGAAN
jgi:transposase